MDPYLLQKQVRDNSEDIRSFLSELKSWEVEMKRKDKELLQDTSEDHTVPPIRSKAKKPKQVNSNLVQSSDKETNLSKRISSYDYSAWDKFDVDKACADIDDQSEREGDKETEDEEENFKAEPTCDSAKLQEQALYEKELGNEHVKNQRWTEAIQCYSKAIECNPYDAIFYANRGLCYLKIKKAKFAEMDCSSAIQLDNSYVKAYQRRALARVEMGHKQDARADFKKVLELEPNNAAAKSELAKLDKPPPTIAKDKKIVLKYVDAKNKKPKQEKILSTKKSECREEVLHGGGDACSIKPDVWKPGDLKGNSPLVEDGVKVTPIHKPPHLRSKKPLREVPVIEVDSFDEIPDLLGTMGGYKKEAPKIEVIEEASSGALVSKEDLKQLEEDQIKQERLQLNENEVRVSSAKGPCNSSSLAPSETKHSESSTINLPPVPTSSVQFFTSWRAVKSNPVLRFQYLKQVPGSELPNIFQESLESKEFGEILQALNLDFIEKEEPVYSHLLGLSHVKRFSTLVMFLSKAEKTVIKNLLQFSEERRHCSNEQIVNLKKCYEIN